ncbi:MAG: UDP-N-acetylmuramate--L-alanine ligase, partial [Clostridia bacterium]|nr:UDP-N-acetylmuramate--L-alanine ligase [Clostridia bacterium]
MSALAKYLIKLGKTVYCSDREESSFTRELGEMGIEIDINNFNDVNLKISEVIVYTDAIPPTDFRLVQAQRQNKEIISRGQFLYEISRSFSSVIAFSGCHGKTTCTAMAAHVFNCAKKNFTSHVGGRDLSFSNFYSTGNDYFLTEACEYKKNFLLLKPNIAVVLNANPDHLECYGSEENLKKAYSVFLECADVAISLYADCVVKGGITFGFDNRANYYATKIKNDMGKYSFFAHENGRQLGEIKLNVYGKHNVLNALAVIAVSRSVGIAFCDIKRGLCEFVGVERRFENIGNYNGAQVIADYAHHPDEIKAVLRVAKKITVGDLYVVFQPHTYSRTKTMFKRFVAILSSV